MNYYTLITGASRGIGKAMAEEFARHECNLLLTARSKDELRALAETLQEEYGVQVKVFALDLLEQGAPGRLLQFCQEQAIGVRVLVNNAGFGLWKHFEEADPQELLAMMQLNQQVVVQLCHQFLPMLKEMPEAHILNVASTAAFQPFPGFAVYAASKAFVYSFSQSLRYELKHHGINVTCLCPGPTETEFFTNARFNHRLDKAEGIKMPVEDVARKAVAALLAKEAVVVPGFSNKLGAWFSKLLPSSFTTAMLGKMVKYRNS